MRLIINEIFDIENFDSAKLAKYIRCMFQAVLPLDDGLALQLLGQALQIAREGRQVRLHAPPPPCLASRAMPPRGAVFSLPAAHGRGLSPLLRLCALCPGAAAVSRRGAGVAGGVDL